MDPKEIPAWVSAAASVASAIGVFLAFRQLKLTKYVAQTLFEDNLGREYRDLIAQLPVEALLGEPLPEEEYRRAFDELFRYIDLSNEQVFLRQRRRVSAAVWVYWSTGIRSNLARPAFAQAWVEVQARCDSFQELRRVVQEDFAHDPAIW